MPPPVHRLSSLLAPITALLATLQGQSHPSIPPEHRSVHAWPETIATAQYDPVRMRLVRLTPGRGVDAIVLRSLSVATSTPTPSPVGELFALRDVERAHACVPLATALDFAIVPLGLGGEAALALDGSGNLVLWRWPAGNTSPQSQWLASWPGFRRLAAVATASGTEIFGYDAAGVRIRRATWNGVQLSQSTLAFAPPNLGTIEALDWNGDGHLELVLNTPSESFITDLGLGAIATVSWTPNPTVAASRRTAVSRSPADGDLLVTVTTSGATSDVAWRNSSVSGSLALGSYAISTISAYDRDGDGDQDLLLGDANHNVVHVLMREPNGFVPWQAQLLTGSAAPDGGLGAVVGGDIDGDGDGDIVACQLASMQLHTFLDAIATPRRVEAIAAYVPQGPPGPVLELPVSIRLPPGLLGAVPGTTALLLDLDGWLADPTTGFVAPTRLVQREVQLSPTQPDATTVLEIPTATFQNGGFHLQLHARVVAVTALGARYPLPSTLLHVTNDPLCEARIRAAVELETTGRPIGPTNGDGGGDGNILGRKTGRHQIGAPPE